jgi:hypothetical protein
MWDAVATFMEETGLHCDQADIKIAERLQAIIKEIEAGHVDMALR